MATGLFARAPAPFGPGPEASYGPFAPPPLPPAHSVDERAPQPAGGDRPEPERRGGGDRIPHSLTIGRVLGVRVAVHWSFVLLVALVVAGEWSSGARHVLAGLVWVAALFASVVAHEVAHSLVARRVGAAVRGILLLPVGGISLLDRMPAAPAREAAVAAAGPALSLVLGLVLLAVGLGAGSAVWPPTLLAGSWWARLGWLNLLLGGFNLLPALPMDGGRLLRAALARHRSPQRATHLAAAVARAVSLGMVVLGVLWTLWLALIGVLVLLGASAEEAAAGHPGRR